MSAISVLSPVFKSTHETFFPIGRALFAEGKIRYFISPFLRDCRHCTNLPTVSESFIALGGTKEAKRKETAGETSFFLCLLFAIVKRLEPLLSKHISTPRVATIDERNFADYTFRAN